MNHVNPHDYFYAAKEHHASQAQHCDCKLIPECVAHHALQAMHNELVVQPYLKKQRRWWRQLAARFREWRAGAEARARYQQGWGSNL